MLATSLAEINRKNRSVWRFVHADQDNLLRRKYMLRFVKSQFCDPSGPSYCVEPTALPQEPSFYAHLLAEMQRFSAIQQVRAKESRRKALATGQSPRQLVQEFTSDPGQSSRRTKLLWEPFLLFLKSRDLNPTIGDDYYQFQGKAKPVRITFRRFEKLVSEVAPRRPTQ